MPLSKLQFKPGINREGTNYSNEGGWFDGDKSVLSLAMWSALVGGKK